jgi:hypothetical protein
MKSIISLLVLSIIPVLSFTQTTDTSTMICPSIGYDFRSSQSFSIGCSILKWPHDGFMWSPSKTYGLNLEIGINTNSSQKIYSNNIGIQGTLFSILSGKLSLAGATDFNKYQTYIKPELGISIFQFASFHYGYNLYFSNSNKFNLERHSLSLRIGIIYPKKNKSA